MINYKVDFNNGNSNINQYFFGFCHENMPILQRAGAAGSSKMSILSIRSGWSATKYANQQGKPGSICN